MKQEIAVFSVKTAILTKTIITGPSMNEEIAVFSIVIIKTAIIKAAIITEAIPTGATSTKASFPATEFSI